MSLTFADCLGLCDLTEQEVLAIAEHEHIPRMAAVELGSYLAQTPAGERRIKEMIVEDIAHALEQNDRERVLTLKVCLKHFLEHHVA